MNSTQKNKKKAMARLNTRIPHEDAEYVKSVVKKSKDNVTEGDIYRLIIKEGIISHKKHVHGN
jgi:hypothetical protein